MSPPGFACVVSFRSSSWTRRQQPSTPRRIVSSRRPFAVHLAAAPPSSSPIAWTPWWAAAGSWCWTAARCVAKPTWLIVHRRDNTAPSGWNSFPSWRSPWFTAWIGPSEVMDWRRQRAHYLGGLALESTRGEHETHTSDYDRQCHLLTPVNKFSSPPWGFIGVPELAQLIGTDSVHGRICLSIILHT